MDVAELLADLNEPQRDAVAAADGPLLVLAGPGSGKTRVLTHRVAYLVAVGRVEPWRIMAVTFTNKAAREMRGRVQALVGQEALHRLTLGTFHAICARLLRVESEAMGRDPDFVIFDQDDQLLVVRRAMQELGLDDKRLAPRAALGAISAAKCELIGPGEYGGGTYVHELIGRVYDRYQRLLRASNALDFDDLLVDAARLLRHDEEVRRRYRRRYRHVLVDEFQDTNTAQYVLVKTLVGADEPGAARNLFVVGDEDQSIYRWRGADYRNVERFRRDFPDAGVVLLEQSYRSTQTILDAARAVIDRNERRTPKKLWTQAGMGAPLCVFQARDGDEEAAYVAGEIERAVRSGARHGEFAVMYRTNAQSRVLEEAFLRRGMPYQLVGATRFYDRREIKDAIAYLRLTLNPLDEVSLGRVINVPPRGIGARSWQALSTLAADLGVPRWTALQAIASGEAAGAAERIDSRMARSLTAFHAVLQDLHEARERLPVGELLDFALDRSGYRDWLRDGTEEGEDRWANVMELHAVAADVGGVVPGEGLVDLLQSVALVSEVDDLAEVAERVTLLTLHAAKGLEFPTVFLVGLEEHLLPHSRSLDDGEALAEERRLFYVGLTRARSKLYVTHAAQRNLFGRPEPRERSRFLDDLPQRLVHGRGGARAGRPGRSGSRLVDTRWERSPATPPLRPAGGALPGAADDTGFGPGDKVCHPTFGLGVVVSCVALDGDVQVTVAFVGAGVRKLLQSYAGLEKA
jgi:DNA helicase II / ATP-dependent DNA helicase PcrA